FLNTSFISFIYCLKGTGVSLESFFFLIKNITIKTEIRQNKGIEKKGKNQITAVKAAPKIGLNTLPAVFAVSIIPSVALATDSLGNRSPTNGSTIGMAPEAPIPCKIVPNKIILQAWSIFQDASPAINPPIAIKIKGGIISFFPPKRTKK